MMRVTSLQNAFLKHVRQLSSNAKARREAGQTLFEGIHVCQAYLAAGKMPTDCIVSDSALKNSEAQAILDGLDDSIDPISVPDSVFAPLSTVDNGVGIIFVVATPADEVMTELSGSALLLDGVQDPGNMGALLRTAAAAGIKSIYLSESSANAWAPRVIRAAMGAHMSLQLFEHVDLDALVAKASVPVFATSLMASQTIYEADLTVESAWLFGAEGRGVSETLLALCEKNTIIIPQTDGVESLNVAAAAAVCLFEQRRQRLATI